MVSDLTPMPKTSAFLDYLLFQDQAFLCVLTLPSDIIGNLLDIGSEQEIGSEHSFTCYGKDGNENGNIFEEKTDNESACMETTSDSIYPISTTGWKKPFDPSFPNPVLKHGPT
jgi:hypothetical protein